MVARANPEPTILPSLRWDAVSNRMSEKWVARDAPHMSIMGQTRSGKTYLIANGILPLCERDRVLIIDVKGDDPSWAGIGQKVTKLNRVTRDMWVDKRKPRAQWYRLIVHDDWDAARNQVLAALKVVYKEGDWVVVLDETRALSDPRAPGLNLKPQIEQLWLRGGSRGIAVVAGTQAPRWVPSSFYDQPSFVWIGRVEDEVAQKRMLEIGGLTKDMFDGIRKIQRHSWFYLDNIDTDPKFMGVTKVGS